MAEYITVNDIHLGPTPSTCTPTYLDDLFDLLDRVGDLITTDTAAVVFTGDVFDRKIPTHTSHSTVRRLAAALRRWPVPTLIVPGNHDVQFDRLDTLDDTQPLGVIFAAGAAHQLHGWSAVDAGIITDPVYGVPWLSTFDDPTVAAALNGWRTRFTGAQPGLIAAHAPLYPPGKELPYENYPAVDWAARMGQPATAMTVAYGHVHEDHGIYQVTGVTFSNPGALSRGSLKEHNLTRGVAVGIWDSTTGDIRHVTLPHKPADQVFLLAKARQRADDQVRADAFVQAVGTTELAVTSIEAVRADIRTRTTDPRLVGLVDDLLDHATAKVRA